MAIAKKKKGKKYMLPMLVLPAFFFSLITGWRVTTKESERAVR